MPFYQTPINSLIISRINVLENFEKFRVHQFHKKHIQKAILYPTLLPDTTGHDKTKQISFAQVLNLRNRLTWLI